MSLLQQPLENTSSKRKEEVRDALNLQSTSKKPCIKLKKIMEEEESKKMKLLQEEIKNKVT